MIATTTAPKAATAVVAITPLETSDNTPGWDYPESSKNATCIFWTPTHGCACGYVRRSADPPPLKWSDLRYVFDIQEDCNGKEAIQA
jgi:hypothetical protein